MKDLRALSEQLHALVLFRSLLQDPVVRGFLQLGGTETKSKEESIHETADFISALFSVTDDLSTYVLNLVLEDENTFIRRAGTGTLTARYREALDAELDTLQALCEVTPEDIRRITRVSLPLPVWDNTPVDLKAIYHDRIAHIGEQGYGMWAKYRMFSLKDGKIMPVKHPDLQQLSDFSGYALERSRIIANTKALLAGNPCNNVLLYGDAGSGKSSTVKAIVNEYYTAGLRLIEVKKSELYFLPDIMDKLAKNPLKFIIFIDDLSFSRDDADFSALKAILEGSVAGRSHNIAIYATSNRYHLVKECVSDRDGDDLHLQDTIQELTSLSARFGLKITFSKPDKKLFAQIVCDLAAQHNIDLPQAELLQLAEAHALRNGGRSPRTAKQFVEYLAYSSKA